MSDNLYDMASRGDLTQVRTILAQRDFDCLAAHPDTQQYAFMYALELPVSYARELKEHKTQIFYLLKPDLSNATNYCDKSGNNMLHYLIQYYYEEPLQYVLRQTQNSNDFSIFFQSNHFGQQPIHYAIRFKQDKLFAELLGIPGMLTNIDWNNRNLIHHIAHYGTPDMLIAYCKKLSLEERSTYINAVDIDGKTPYEIAKTCNSTDNRLEIMELLITYGASPSRSWSPT